MSGTTSPSLHQPSFFSETTSLTLEFLSDIIQQIQSLPDLKNGHEHFWNQDVTKITLSISQFVEISTLLSRAVTAQKGVSLNGFKESHIQLLFIMKGVNQASVNGDYIALEELLKYELKDNLTQWKIDLIPQIKKLLIN